MIKVGRQLPMMNSEGLIFPFFSYLRRSGFPLGVGDYLVALDILRSGRGLENIDDIYFSCRLLWVKSIDDQITFDNAFQIFVKPRLITQPIHTSNGRNGDSTGTSNGRPEKNSLMDYWNMNDQPKPASNEFHLRSIPLSKKISEEKEACSPKIKETFQLTPRLPLSKRDLASIWRHYRKLKPMGPVIDFDIAVTISDICKNGVFLKAIYKQRRKNQAKLLIIQDIYGSMYPFNLLVNLLIESLNLSGLHDHIFTYYFHNYPNGFLSPNPKLGNWIALEDVLSIYGKDNGILVISDGGAARGSFRKERIMKTEIFINYIKEYTNHYAWLNPVPSERWVSTTAEDISLLVPMFSFTRSGMLDIIKNLLSGQTH